jgi:AcrR family transcriptional regulator
VPRLRDETYTARRRHILDAARACFARKGFHAASMLDLQAEAGVSAGAIYVYFKGKHELVLAIAEENTDRLAAALDGALGAPAGTTLRDTLVAVVRQMDRIARGPYGGAGFDVWAEAGRDPAIRRIVRTRQKALVARFAEVAHRAIARGELPAEADPDTVGATLFGACVVGYYTQRLTLDGPGPEAYVDGLLAGVGARR